MSDPLEDRAARQKQATLLKIDVFGAAIALFILCSCVGCCLPSGAMRSETDGMRACATAGMESYAYGRCTCRSITTETTP